MVAMEGRLSDRISKVESGLIRVEQKLDAAVVNLTRQIDGIDLRLDSLEIEKLPARVAALEQAIA